MSDRPSGGSRWASKDGREDRPEVDRPCHRPHPRTRRCRRPALLFISPPTYGTPLFSPRFRTKQNPEAEIVHSPGNSPIPHIAQLRYLSMQIRIRESSVQSVPYHCTSAFAQRVQPPDLPDLGKTPMTGTGRGLKPPPPPARRQRTKPAARHAEPPRPGSPAARRDCHGTRGCGSTTPAHQAQAIIVRRCLDDPERTHVKDPLGNDNATREAAR